MRALFIALTLIVSLASSAAEVASPSANKNSKDKGSSSHNFEDLLVQGKYHFSDEAVTTVEEDKVLDSLLGVRSDFKDRIEKSSLKN